MKKYIEGEEQGIQQSESQQLRTPQPQTQSMHIIFSWKTFIFIIFFKDIETSKVIATPVVARPRVIQKTGMIIEKKIFKLSF
jgi:hypothetical protein